MSDRMPKNRYATMNITSASSGQLTIDIHNRGDTVWTNAKVFYTLNDQTTQIQCDLNGDNVDYDTINGIRLRLVYLPGHTYTCSPNDPLVVTQDTLVTFYMTFSDYAYQDLYEEPTAHLNVMVHAPPVNCTGAYSEPSECSYLCGGGTQTSTWIVDQPASNGGTCDHPDTIHVCNTQPCSLSSTGVGVPAPPTQTSSTGVEVPATPTSSTGMGAGVPAPPTPTSSTGVGAGVPAPPTPTSSTGVPVSSSTGETSNHRSSSGSSHTSSTAQTIEGSTGLAYDAISDTGSMLASSTAHVSMSSSTGMNPLQIGNVTNTTISFPQHVSVSNNDAVVTLYIICSLIGALLMYVGVCVNVLRSLPNAHIHPEKVVHAYTPVDVPHNIFNRAA
jgi:hypothetical protein